MDIDLFRYYLIESSYVIIFFAKILLIIGLEALSNVTEHPCVCEKDV